MIRCVLFGLALVLVCVHPLSVTAQARLIPDGITVQADKGATVLEVLLDQGVPWRVSLHDTPMRIQIDLEGLAVSNDDFTPPAAQHGIAALRAGSVRAGLSRVIAELTQPMHVAQAGMEIDPASGAARLTLRLRPTNKADFAARLADPDPNPAQPGGQSAPDKLVVLLDPGHGGRDFGARAGALSEAEIMLTFAQELKTMLEDTTDFDVNLTRQTDRFVSLEDRIAQAGRVGADVLISLHADALLGQQAEGAAVYTLSPEARDAADDWLQALQPGGGLLQSADLTAQSRDVAAALLDLSRRRTSPRSTTLAHALVGAMERADLTLYKTPEKQANFVVLRSADVPSVLIELGFLSNRLDRARLIDPAWRGFMAQAIRDGLLAWSVQDYNQRVLRPH